MAAVGVKPGQDEGEKEVFFGCSYCALCGCCVRCGYMAVLLCCSVLCAVLCTDANTSVSVFRLLPLLSSSPLLAFLNQVKMKGSSSGKPEDNKVSLHASFLSTSCGGVFHSLGYKTLSNMER